MFLSAMPTLPQIPATQPSQAAATAGLVGASSAPSQQVTALAIPATGAAAAFSTKSDAPRNVPLRTSLPQPQRPSILPDPDFWRVPMRETGEPIAAAVPPPPQAIRINLPLASQYQTQLLAQHAPSETGDEPVLPAEKPPTGEKKPSFGRARGVDAYGIATQRLTAIAFPPSLAPLSA